MDGGITYFYRHKRGEGKDLSDDAERHLLTSDGNQVYNI
jgi:hypothetical protein